MEKKRNLGVTEARFALTILTCLLVAIGYITLLRLVGPKDLTADNSPDDTVPPAVAGPIAPPAATEIRPHVLPVVKSDDTHGDRPSIAKRPDAEQIPASELR